MHPEVDKVQSLGQLDLQQSAMRFRQLVDWAPVSIAMFDLDMRYIELSQGWRDDCQIGNRKVIGLLHYELFPDLPERWKEVHRRCLAGATERCETDLFHRPDGSAAWIRWEVKPWRNDAGEIAGIVMWTEDITERKLAEAKLRENDRRFETALTKSPLSVWEQDVDLRYTWFYNPKLGYALQEVIGKTDAELMDPACVKELEALKRRVLETGQSIRQEVMAAAPGEPLQFYDLSIDALRDTSGRVVGITCASAEITERKRIEEELKESEQRFKALISSLQIGVLVQSEKDEILLCNSKSMELLGLTNDQLLGRSSMDPDWGIVDEEGSRLLPEEMPSMRAARTLKSVRNVILGVNRPLVGGRIWLQVQAEPVLHSNGKLSHVVVSFVDVSDLRNARLQAQEKQHKLSDQTERLAAILDHMADAVITIDTAGKIESFNQAAKKMFGYESDEVISCSASLLLGEPKTSEKAGLLSDFSGTERSYPAGPPKEVLGIRKNGTTFALNISATQTRSGDNTLTVALLRDLTEQRLKEEEIQNLAFYDPLTKLPNRRMLTDRLKQALANTTRHNRQGALLFIDLDHFKTLNDTQGHFMGDLLLQQVAKRLSTCVREGDTVARLGGDEFVVMLENLSESDTEAAVQAEGVGEKILATLGEPYILENRTHNSTPSVGITLFDASTQSVEEPLKRADLAMYQAKAAGRNTFRFFNPDLQLAVSRLLELKERLARAVVQSEFVLYYQPQVMQSGQVSGVEVLLRWNDPERGMVSPTEFIPVAEETGLILPLGHWVLQSACQQLAKWAAQVTTSQLTVAVNVSAKQMAQDNFVTELLGVLEQTGANPALLKLEITESMLVNSIEEVIAKMVAIKALGVGFSIDDFGTGYSSLSYLKRLPLDQLKIDQSFVRDILEDPNDAAIANMVIALASSMKLSVIAEGVESLAQRDFLARQGCSTYQGYLFSKPLPVGAFEAWLHTLP